jgi:hypothetical protein
VKLKKIILTLNIYLMKKISLYFLTVSTLLFSGITSKAQTLSSNLFSQNGWIADTVGGGSPYSDASCPGYSLGIECIVSTTKNMNKNNRWLDVKNSQARLVRYGGTTVDQNYPERWQYLKFVDSVRAKGMEPILQIPVNWEDASGDYDTTRAKNTIIYINQTMARNVIYWSIGNEPDLNAPKGYGYNTAASAIKIANYIKDFSKAMRRAVPSVPIKIMGPELASWNTNTTNPMKIIVDSLVAYPGVSRCDITGKDPVTNKWWIDHFSFHSYSWHSGNQTAYRDSVIAKLRGYRGLAANLAYLKTKLHIADSTHLRTVSPIKMAITEANIAAQTDTADTWEGIKCNSFMAGQFWLEIASIAAEYGVDFINYWSASETSMGYIRNSTGAKKSTYYHFKKAAENFSGTYYTGKDSSNTSPSTGIKNIKAFGTIDANHIAVIILNQDTVNTASQIYKIRLDNSYATGTGTRIKMNMGIAKEYLDTIDASSTTMLEFDLNGNISQKYTYKQSSGSSSPGFQQNTCSLDKTYADQTALGNYVPSVYSNLTIGNGSNSITIGTTNNHIYRAVNSITINGDFEVPLGQSLELLPTPCN